MKNKRKYLSLLILSLIIVSIYTLYTQKEGLNKIVFISWLSFFAMIISIFFVREKGHSDSIVLNIWMYGVSSGAMIISSFLFLAPMAIKNSKFGSIGIGIGLIIGFAIHTFSHNASHKLEDIMKYEQLFTLTTHTIFAGLAIGIIYSQTPTISLLLAISIISHKLPASISVVNTLNKKEKQYIIIPATIFGLACMISFLMLPQLPTSLTKIIFGVGAGAFIHLSIDFLPDCDQGRIYDIIKQTEREHNKIDRARTHSVVSVIIGFIIILIPYLIIKL